jgi:hypothetical protein
MHSIPTVKGMWFAYFMIMKAPVVISGKVNTSSSPVFSADARMRNRIGREQTRSCRIDKECHFSLQS